MKRIDLFYQGQQLDGLKHMELDADTTVGVLRKMLIEKHGLPLTVLVFLEDIDEPVGNEEKLLDYATPKGLKIHIHSARELKVLVTFNGKTVEAHFAPSATVSLVKRWAAEKEFGMSPSDAGEHVLQLAGTADRPAPGTHIGSLLDDKDRLIAFDLVPDERVQGMA